MSSSTSHPYPTHGLALQLTEHHQKKPLTLARVPIPALGKGEVLVHNVAVAQNPVDAKQVDYDFGINELPWTNGGDVSGVVVAVGDGVEHLKVGDRVAAFLSRKTARHGGYQEYSIASAPQTFKIPSHLTHEEASTIPLAFATAVGGIFGDLHVPIPSKGASLPLPLNAETPILVWGGASSVGAFAIQLARLSGYRVITTASPANFEYVKSLGADVVIDYKDGEKAVEEIKKASGGKLRLVVDAISEHGSAAFSARAIGPDGGIISVVLPIDESWKGGRTDIEIVSSGARIVYEKPAFLDSFRFLVEALEERKIVPNRVEVIPNGLLGVDEGWRRQRAHEIRGVKLVYRIAETPGIKDQ